jgi:pheromone a factor receptor
MILPESFRLAARATAPVYMVAPNTPPYTTPGLTANLVLRVSLAAIANLVCLVPLRLLYRNGEIAAVIFIVTVELKNIFAILFALLWQNDDMESWWPGYGLCDFYGFFYNAAAGIYVTCLLAIMRNLAHQVGLLRANPLTVNEKRRRNLIQLLIIFPLPIVQMAFTYPLAAQRYSVGTLMGCTWVPSSSWPYIVFFVIAQPIIAVVTSIYASMYYYIMRYISSFANTF